MYFLFGGGDGDFLGGGSLRERHKGFFGEVGGGNNVVCLKSRTLLTCLLEKKSDVVEFFIWGKEFFWGGGNFYGGEIERFFRRGVKFWEEKSRVQSPESRVQSPESRVQSSF